MTTIKSISSSRSIGIRRSTVNPDRVILTIDGDDGPNFIDYVPRSEFLEAAAELDAIVIPREEFPEIELKDDWIVSNGDYHGTLDSVNGPDEIRREAIGMFAIAEFLEANPLVDEEQVAAIAVALADARLATDGRNETFMEEARRLYLAGVRVGGDDQ